MVSLADAALVGAHAIAWPVLAAAGGYALFRAAQIPGAESSTAARSVRVTVFAWVAAMAAMALLALGAVVLVGRPAAAVLAPFAVLWAGSGLLVVLILRRWGARVVRESDRAAELAEMERIKTELINQVAHGLYTPLMPVRIHLHLLEGDLGSRASDRQKESLRVMDRNLARLNRIVEQVVLASQIQTDRLQLNLVKGRLDTVVRQAVRAAREEAFEGAPQIDVELSGPIEVTCDPDQLKTILHAALEEAMRRSASSGRVRVEACLDGHEAVVRVHDEGGDAGDTAGVLERFATVHQRNAGNEHDLGLGLFVGRGVVERHGGRFWLERGADGGRVVSMSLPAVEA